MVNCPLCDAPIDVEEEELDEGDPLICEECGANLIVTGVNPLEIEDDDEDEDPDLEDEEEEEEDEWK
jgi:alpha-aminoadipate carrier protein LysW